MTSLDLTYTYHHHNVSVSGFLYNISPDHIDLKYITSWENHKAAYSVSDWNKVATGLHLYHGDVIHLMRQLK